MSDVLDLVCRVDPARIVSSDLVAVFDSLEIVPSLLFGDEVQQAEGIQHLEDAFRVVASRSSEAGMIERLQSEFVALGNDAERERLALIPPAIDRASRHKLLLGLRDVFVIFRSRSARSAPASSVLSRLTVIAQVPRRLLDPRADVSVVHEATRAGLFAFGWSTSERTVLDQWRL
jgi:hypothetical protein